MIRLRNERRSVGRQTFVALLTVLSLPLICVGQEDILTEAESSGQAHMNATVVVPDSLHCQLQEGVTTFVVQMPKGPQRDRFTFINENAAVHGELRISVSNDKLTASDPRWTSVDGTISFNHKRRFNLSMVGVDANYVKLSFHVEKADRIAALGL